MSRSPKPLTSTDANILALLADVQPVALTAELSQRICEAAAATVAHVERLNAVPPSPVPATRGPDSSSITTAATVPGVLCPWLASTTAVRQLLSQGFKVVAVECQSAAVERACAELGLGAEERGCSRRLPSVAAIATTTAAAAAGGCCQAFPLHAVWDVWGLLVTPPELLSRYAAVWAELLPRGGAWLAAAAVCTELLPPPREPAGAAADGCPALAASLSSQGLHVHDLAGVLMPTLERAGFAIVQLLAPSRDQVAEEAGGGVAVANGDLTEQSAEDALSEALEAALNLRASLGWAGLEGEEVSAAALTRALGEILKNTQAGLQGRAATVYATILSIQDAPDVGKFLKHHSMRGNPEMFQLLLETLVDLTGSTAASGKPEKGSKRGGAAARNQGSHGGGASVAEAAFAVLPLAMDPRHHSVTQIASVVCQRITPVLVGIDTAKRSGHGWDRRTAALNLIKNFFSTHDAAQPCRAALLRRICLRTPEKADYRQVAINSVQTLLSGCTPAEVRAFCLFLYRLSRNPKIAHRTIAVDLAAVFLSTMPAPFAATDSYQRLLDGSCGAGDQLDAPWSAICLAIIVARANDKSPTVRGKAIGCLADIVQTFAKRLLDAPDGGREAADIAAFLPAFCASRHICVQVNRPHGAGTGDADGGSDNDAEGAGGSGGRTADDKNEGPGIAPPPETEATATIPGKVSLELSWMRAMCHSRCRDDKAAVRKVALQLLESVLELCAAAARAQPPLQQAAGQRAAAEGPSAEDIQVLEDGTADSLVSVRKAALQVVCNLVVCYPHNADLACIWARCVLPLIRDPESAIQEVVVERLSNLLLEPVAVLGSRGGGGRGRQQACAELQPRFAALAQMGRAASSCLGKALGMMAAKKLLKGPQVAAGLEAFLTTGPGIHVDNEREDTATEDAAGTGAAAQSRGSQIDTQQERQLQRREQHRVARDQREGAWMLLVEVAGHDPAAPSWQFLQRCWDELQAGCAGTNGERSAQEGAMLLWVISHAASRFPAADAANLASGLLSAILGFNLPCAAVAAHLVALHKLTQAEGGQAVVGQPAEWCAKVQVACEEVLTNAMESRGNMSNALATHCQLALFTLGEVALLQETALPGGAAVKAAVSSHAWTCLGKMCMADEGLAKKCVPLLEMSGSPNPVVRINLLVGLADMVVQFTGLADAYVGRLADMVRDPHELVRRQALALLANLLLRDYVKWRGSLVHRRRARTHKRSTSRPVPVWEITIPGLCDRFLLALVDESPSVRQLAQYLLSDSLVAKAPMLAYNHFIESLFVLNACSAGLHARRAAGAAAAELASELVSELALHSSQEGSGSFHLKGATPVMRAKRDIIYTALLRRMSPEHRFSAFARLTADILGGVVDGLLPLAEADEVLGDALRLLACPDMKVNANRFGAPAEEDMEQLTGTQEDVAKARGKLVGAMMRKHLVDSVMPLMVELRYMLQAQKHPLLGSLMLCMATLLRDYKSEVEDILVSDKQLALEITHDIKHYETLAKQQQRQQEAAMAAALAVKPAAACPSASNARATPQNHAAALAATAAASHLTPPAHVERQRRQTAILPGVEPARTPLAAEVLATASRRGLQGPQQAMQRTPIAAAGPGVGPSAAAVTPAARMQGAACQVSLPFVRAQCQKGVTKGNISAPNTPQVLPPCALRALGSLAPFNATFLAA
ncbi:hypothetical protein VOLCADRAFT_118285 [Volvox carteri f. nagariensis]|uniref:Condensin complex subunit 1 C-terminal domain-containing protein n=1 Tax=Volvox carteri f. nagariensis TaxID=3068 RepID=D8U385_VOLCA|nr:uncharacterized protein VOLCADRAFT_118285 [Volvox carteri f. nagariensis]EFJ45782.1 hypothetical protein VOLCADRAFT_118285 [Volvox carteri f. nagariensis]|eukprot:XP_002953183.1 hypothetical protein VOLCADRAFT_118285 [Volvox carteri f. nagariensis]